LILKQLFKEAVIFFTCKTAGVACKLQKTTTNSHMQINAMLLQN